MPRTTNNCLALTANHDKIALYWNIYTSTPICFLSPSGKKFMWETRTAWTANNIFKHISLNGNYFIVTKMSAQLVANGPIDNKTALLQIMTTESMCITKTLFCKNNPGFHLTHWGRDKWTPFGRRHFQMHFLEWKCLNSYYNFTKVCS